MEGSFAARESSYVNSRTVSVNMCRCGRICECREAMDEYVIK